MELKQALEELRKGEKRKFAQGVDLIINLKGIDTKKDNVSAIVPLPHKIKEKKICGFFTKKSELVTTITNLDFPRYKDKKALKKLVKEFDFFIAVALLMPSVATAFGKVLGPVGKMPSPQLGIVGSEDPRAVKDVLDKISNSLKIRVKELSVKILIGKESMKDEEIISNIQAVYNGLISVLPIKKDNVKNVMIKFTMSKPIKVEVK